jgi:hypothetical protein
MPQIAVNASKRRLGFAIIMQFLICFVCEFRTDRSAGMVLKDSTARRRFRRYFRYDLHNNIDGDLVFSQKDSDGWHNPYDPTDWNYSRS